MSQSPSIMRERYHITIYLNSMQLRPNEVFPEELFSAVVGDRLAYDGAIFILVERTWDLWSHEFTLYFIEDEKTEALRGTNP